MRDYLNIKLLNNMKEILEAKLEELNYALNNDIIAEEGYSFMLGQQELLIRLLDECVHVEYSYDTHDYYESRYDDDYWYNDEESRYYDDLEYYKQEEIDNLYDVFNQHSWWIGKNVMSIDSYWFTSDEIEAFRVIWQRRLSA
jgi:hypothetical protein